MNVGSLFSGIGGIDLGLERAGMSVLWQCESKEWRRSVLRERFPGVECFEDVRAVASDQVVRREIRGDAASSNTRQGGLSAQHGSDVDLLCGGFPCQDLSVAGRRAGLAGDRSGLFFEFARIAESLRPRYLLVENVPGLLSSNGGRDFGVVLGTLADIGYGLGWRILDSRYFGVPQRRRRVFILGVLPGGRAGAISAGEILAVGTRCSGHLAARGEAGADVANSLGGSLGKGGGPDGNLDRCGALVTSLQRSGPPGSRRDDDASLVTIAAPLSHGSNPNSNMVGRRREDDENLVAFAQNSRDEVRVLGPNAEGDHTGSLASQPGMKQQTYLAGGASVRRLTPTECERLQGFPDDWTALGPDSRRYAALGDAVTVNVSEWIGRRILEAEAMAA